MENKLVRYLISDIRSLFCNHDYYLKVHHVKDNGMGKVFMYKCKKCGKRKFVFE